MGGLIFGRKFIICCVLLACAAFATAFPARSQNAIWDGFISSDWNTGIVGDASNWSTVTTPSQPAPVPTNTAFFPVNAFHYFITFSQGTTIENLRVLPNAPLYQFDLSGKRLDIGGVGGAGIFNEAAIVPIFHVTAGSEFRFFGSSSVFGSANIIVSGVAGTEGRLVFNASSSAGNAQIVNRAHGLTFFDRTSHAAQSIIVNTGTGAADYGLTTFLLNSSALLSQITNNNFGSTVFKNDSTAGQAKITNDANGSTLFIDKTTAGSATIINNKDGSTRFADTTTAGSARITNNGGGETRFLGNTEDNPVTAANATITTNDASKTTFSRNSTGGNATLITNNGGKTIFELNSTGGLAAFDTRAGGIVDISPRFVPPGTLTPILFGLIDVPKALNVMTAGSIEGAGTYLLGEQPFAVGFNNRSTTVSGVIADGGSFGGTGASLIKAGSGTLTLAGTNTYTGGTVVVGGALNVAGSIAASSGLTVIGATASGTGALPTTQLGIGGVIAPGNSIGTLSVNGNVTFGSGSIYQAEANAAGQSDKVVATGQAMIQGGTVQVLAQQGTYAPSTSYTILSAQAGINGTFAGVSSNLAFLTPSLGYSGNSVTLTMNVNGTDQTGTNLFSSVAETRNQRATALALEQGGLNNTLANSILNQTGSGALAAFDALSGEIHGTIISSVTDDSRFLREAVLGRMRQPSYENALTLASMASGPFAKMESSRNQRLRGKDAHEHRDVTLWSQGVGSWGSLDSDQNAAAARRNLAGVVAGLDARFGDFTRIGLLGGYSYSGLRTDGRSSSAAIDTSYLGVYSFTKIGAWNFRAGAAYGWHEIDSARSISYPGFFDRATAHYRGGTGQLFGEIGYGLVDGRVVVEPFAGAALVSTSTDAFAEVGGLAALSGRESRTSIGVSNVGVRVARAFSLSEHGVIMPRATVAWQHGIGDVTPVAGVAFQATGSAFSVAGLPIARDAVLVDAGVDWLFNARSRLSLDYVGRAGTRVQDHSVRGAMVFSF